MENNTRYHIFTYNGQQIIVVFANGATSPYDAEALSEYRNRSGKTNGRIGYGGYENGAIIFAHTRPLANMIHRFMLTNGIPLAHISGD